VGFCVWLAQWGQNSGHVGVPLEAIPGFVQKLQAMYSKATGQRMKSPGGAKSPGGGPKKTIGKKDKKPNKPKEKQKPATMEDLDADLVGYTAQRGADEAVGEAAPIS